MAPEQASAEKGIAQAGLVAANTFDLTGDGVRISYSSTSIAGVPLLQYKDAQIERNFRANDITTWGSLMGDLVTVTLEMHVDVDIVRLTLVVPTVNVRIGQQVRFETLAVETTDRSVAFTPPPGPAGPLQTYRIYKLKGVAQFVLS